MIRRNRSHAEDAFKVTDWDLKQLRKEMPADYRKKLEKVESTAEGRAALARYRKFWGLPYPPNIKIIEMPGSSKQTKFLVGMGRSGQGGKIQTSDGRMTRAKGVRHVATDASGRQIFLLSGRNSKASKAALKKVGKVIETHYVPTAQQEKAGTHKKHKYWVHRHTKEENGVPPSVSVDQAGNYIYDRGTYRVTDWIHR